VDCGAIPANLLESELFGHEKGAFTGAAARRIGAFEEANGGTIFLDEIGELPIEMQPKLLRVLEKKHIRRIGANRYEPVDVRVVAATHRDLRSEVNEGNFRSDLYYRLAVVRVPLPPLRTRPDDIAGLVDRLLDTLGADEALRSALVTEEFLVNLQRGAWPGNVRELRNYLERCLVFQAPMPMSDVGEPLLDGDQSAPIDIAVSYEQARRAGIADWERRYLQQLLPAHGGKPSEAARAVAIDRVYLWRLMRKHGIKS
jgi:transcriptional regulator with PAS, ATPase and Fis domain